MGNIRAETPQSLLALTLARWNRFLGLEDLRRPDPAPKKVHHLRDLDYQMLLLRATFASLVLRKVVDPFNRLHRMPVAWSLRMARRLPPQVSIPVELAANLPHCED